jgi:C1A family cysteine protease
VPSTSSAAVPRKIARYGWIPDIPDQRDHMFAAPLAALGPLPATKDLRNLCPPVYNQGQLGSCTANAIGAAIEFDRMKQKLPKLMPSRLFIYYNERVIEGTVKSDSGAQIRDGIKSVAHQGVCPESDWPYVLTKFDQKPAAKAYQDAVVDRAVSYERLIQNLNQLKGCLASGYPFVFGFTVYASFEGPSVAKSGHAKLPASGEQVVGGHAVMAVGYSDPKQWFVVRNSWGTGWGMKGYFTLPYAYVTQSSLASDFWTIRLVGK